MKNISILIYSLCLSACGRPGDVTFNQNMQVQPCQSTNMNGNVLYEYIYSRSNCTTGCHIAQSKHDYCEDLQNNEINNNCAIEERREAFEQEKCR